mmetsp:Transcript_19101/g.38492  ORF Transcript_19101/g.38492 Transcript_19101/m.38492 type:complete len:180 (-) Transcript_19101:538-1077(-)
MRMPTKPIAISAAVLLTLCRSSLGFSSAATHRIGAFSSRSTSARATIHDEWWESRKAANRARAQGQPLPPGTLDEQQMALPLDESNVAQALTEFAQSDYTSIMYNFFGSRADQGRRYDHWRGIFDSAWLDGRTIGVELRPPFDEKKKALLERLAMYLRARFPQERISILSVHRDGQDIY